MDKENVFYFNAGNLIEVRILVFNDAINIYDNSSNDFIKAYPLKGASVENRDNCFIVYPVTSNTEYLQVFDNDPSADSLLKEISKANQSLMRKFFRQRMLWFAVILAAIITGLYFLIVSLVPYIGAALIGRDVEIKMGRQLKDLMLAEENISGAVIDSAGTTRLQAFADRVKLSDAYPIQVTLVNSRTVNAYALPGGQIVVYTGMLHHLTEPGELVALLAHEASHVNRRHSLRAVLRNAADALVIAILFNDVSAITATIIGNAQNLRGLNYSRSAETEADAYGMKIMLENDINVSGMKKLMQILQKQGDVPENFSFLSSHPLTRKRIEATNDFIMKHPQKDGADDSLQTLFTQLKE